MGTQVQHPHLPQPGLCQCSDTSFPQGSCTTPKPWLPESWNHRHTEFPVLHSLPSASSPYLPTVASLVLAFCPCPSTVSAPTATQSLHTELLAGGQRSLTPTGSHMWPATSTPPPKTQLLLPHQAMWIQWTLLARMFPADHCPRLV